MAAISFLGDLLQTIGDRGRDPINFGRGELARAANAADLLQLCEDLISRRGEASGVALARLILERYAALPQEERLAFLRLVAGESMPITRRWTRPLPPTRRTRHARSSACFTRRQNRERRN